jgi:hypothetical protein
MSVGVGLRNEHDGHNALSTQPGRRGPIFCLQSRAVCFRPPSGLGSPLRDVLLELADRLPDGIGLLLDGPAARYAVLHLPDDLRAHLLQVVREARLTRQSLEQPSGHEAHTIGYQPIHQGEAAGGAQIVHIVIPVHLGSC